MKKTIAGLVIATGMIAAPAMAQGQNVAPGGLYVGALAGYEGLDVETDDGSISADADSTVYGVTAGYDLSLGSAFVGVEGELSKSGGSTEFPSSFGGARDGLKADGQYYIGARAGVALTPGIAAYGKLGYTSLDTKSFTSAGSLGELKENASGVRFGAGLQLQLPGPLEGRVEYRRSRYSDVGGDVGDIHTDQIVAGLGVRF